MKHAAIGDDAHLAYGSCLDQCPQGFSFIAGLVKQGVLLGNGDALGLAVLADQHFYQVGYGAVFTQGCNARRLLDAGVDTQVQGGGLGGAHDAPAGEVKNLAL